jgi:hypothetical protein
VISNLNRKRLTDAALVNGIGRVLVTLSLARSHFVDRRR